MANDSELTEYCTKDNEQKELDVVLLQAIQKKIELYVISEIKEAERRGYDQCCVDFNILHGKDAERFVKQAEENLTKTLSEQEVKDIHESYNILKDKL